MQTDREATILAEYEAQLDAAAERLTAARQEHESLSEIVRVLRRRLGRGPQSLPTGVLPTYQGRVTLSSFLRALMADGHRRTLDQVAVIVEQDERFCDQPPSRNTLSNRMHDLAVAGELRRVERGVYEAAATMDNQSGSSSAATAKDVIELEAAGEIRALRADRDVNGDLGTRRADKVVDPEQRMARIGR